MKVYYSPRIGASMQPGFVHGVLVPSNTNYK